MTVHGQSRSNTASQSGNVFGAKGRSVFKLREQAIWTVRSARSKFGLVAVQGCFALTLMTNPIPSEYQPSLRFKMDEDTVTATIVHVFTPFTYSQVVVVRTNSIGRIHLQKDFLLVAKIYDVGFMKERHGIFNKCFGKQVEIPHPWSYELEASAAQNA
jgi:hypothetical protein